MCKEFVYGGCDGNGNRFQDRATCEQQCRSSGERPVDPYQPVDPYPYEPDEPETPAPSGGGELIFDFVFTLKC